MPSFAFADASSNFALEIKRKLDASHIANEILSQHVDEKSKRFVKQITPDYSKTKKGDILIYHATIGSDIVQVYKNHPGKRVMIYHNITPSEFFTKYDRRLTRITAQGRQQLAALAPLTDLAFGVSEYNRKELVALGYQNTDTLPIILNFHEYQTVINLSLQEKLQHDPSTKILFVGRCVPNKKLEDVIKTFYIYRQHFDTTAKLYFVGNDTAIPSYTHELQKIVENLHLDTSVTFTGSIPFADMITYYKCCDVFLSMSEHEGFMVPLLESMYLHLPIIAYNSSAIPYTLADAGILLEDKDYVLAAETIHTLLSNASFRKSVLAKQDARMKDFSPDNQEHLLSEKIDTILSLPMHA